MNSGHTFEPRLPARSLQHEGFRWLAAGALTLLSALTRGQTVGQEDLIGGNQTTRNRLAW